MTGRSREPPVNISAASTAAGLSVKTVRYYADIGLVSTPSRSETGYRTYDESAARKLVFVRRAREFGFSIDECRELLSLYEDQQRSSADVKCIATRRLLPTSPSSLCSTLHRMAASAPAATQSPWRLRSAALAGDDSPINSAERFWPIGPRSGCLVTPRLTAGELGACVALGGPSGALPRQSGPIV